MQLVAGKVQKQDQQIKTLHVQTAEKTTFGPNRTKPTGAKYHIGLCFFFIVLNPRSFQDERKNVCNFC